MPHAHQLLYLFQAEANKQPIDSKSSISLNWSVKPTVKLKCSCCNSKIRSTQEENSPHYVREAHFPTQITFCCAVQTEAQLQKRPASIDGIQLQMQNLTWLDLTKRPRLRQLVCEKVCKEGFQRPSSVNRTIFFFFFHSVFWWSCKRWMRAKSSSSLQAVGNLDETLSDIIYGLQTCQQIASRIPTAFWVR